MNEAQDVDAAQMPAIMIATPMYGGMCTAHYMVGVIDAIAVLSGMGYSVYFANIINESLITRARNELARQFLEQGFDYLMFIDADISFDAKSVLELIRADKDIACGLYPKKEIAWGSIEAAARRGEQNLKDYSGAFALNLLRGSVEAQSDEQGLIELQHGATGFMLIKRQVFEKLSPLVPAYRTSAATTPDGSFLKPLTKEFFATSIDEESGVLLSEDYHFCESWRKLGGKIYANPSIRLEHVGTYVYGGDVTRSARSA
ncbi:MAG TPA: hypothetical protein VI279_06190 [Rhodocyclaceae bacterium]